MRSLFKLFLIQILCTALVHSTTIQKHWLPLEKWESSSSRIKYLMIPKEEVHKAREILKNEDQKQSPSPLELKLVLKEIQDEGILAQYQCSVSEEKFKKLNREKEISYFPFLPPDWIVLSSPKGLHWREDGSGSWEVDSKTKKIDLDVLIPFQRQLSLPTAHSVVFIWAALSGDWDIRFGPSNSRFHLAQSKAVNLLNQRQFEIVPAHQMKAAKVLPKKSNKELAPKPEFKQLAPEVFAKPRTQIKVHKNVIHLSTMLELNFLNGGVDELKLKIPEGQFFSAMRFEPALGFQWTGTSILFPRKIEGKYKFYLNTSLTTQGQSPAKIQLPAFEAVTDLPGRIQIFALENVRVDGLEGKALQSVNPDQGDTLEKLDVPVLYEYRYEKLGEALKMSYTALPGVEGSSYQILSNVLTTVLTQDGQAAHSWKIKVQNFGAYNLSLPLAQDVELLGAYVRGKPVKTFRSETGKLNLHLGSQVKNNDTEINVEVKYLERYTSLPKALKLKIPQEVDGNSTQWSVYYPERWQLKHAKSNLQQDFSIEKTRPWRQSVQLVIDKLLSPSSLIPLLFFLLALIYSFSAFLKLVWNWKNTNYSVKNKVLWALPSLFLIFCLGLFGITSGIFVSQVAQVRYSEGHLEKEVMTMDKGNYRQNAMGLVGGSGGGSAEGFADFDAFDDEMAVQSELSAAVPPPRMKKQKSRPVKRKARHSAVFSSRSAKKMDVFEEKAREARSPYKKVRRSGVKPVEIQFPKLARQIQFHSSYQTLDAPYLELRWDTEQRIGNLRILGLVLMALWSFLTIQCLLRRKYVLFAAFCSAGMMAIHKALPDSVPLETLLAGFLILHFLWLLHRLYFKFQGVRS